MIIKNSKLYDKLKFVAQILLPALGVLYVALAALWSLPEPDKVSGSVLAVDTFLGVLLGISSSQYNNSDERFDGQIDIVQQEGVKRLQIDPFIDPHEFEAKDEILFKMNKVDLDTPEGE
jgi:hypothetical protein